jgi:hypothetical protein
MVHTPRQPTLAYRYAILQPLKMEDKIVAELQGH